MRAKRVVLVATAALLGIGASLATAETSQKGTLRVHFTGKISPHSLPRGSAAPVTVSIGGQVTTTDGSDPPQLRTITIQINRNGRFDYTGLPVCHIGQIQPSTNAAALAACRSSLVGTGTFTADVLLPQQSPFPSEGKVLAFNGTVHGKPVIFAHVFGTDPLPTSYTLSFSIRPTNGTFGTTLTTSLPNVTGEWGFVTGISLTLRRRFHFQGASRSYISAGCPAPKGISEVSFPMTRASFLFAGHKDVVSTLSRSCKVRG